MAITFSINRLNSTPDERAFAVAGATAAGSTWSEATAAAYIASPDHRLACLWVRWPERGIPNFRRVGFVHAYLRPGSTVADVQHLAIDESILPDVAVNADARRRIADKLLIEILDAMNRAGITRARTRRIAKANRLVRYLATLARLTVTDAGDVADFEGGVADVLAQLRARE